MRVFSLGGKTCVCVLSRRKTLHVHIFVPENYACISLCEETVTVCIFEHTFEQQALHVHIFVLKDFVCAYFCAGKHCECIFLREKALCF